MKDWFTRILYNCWKTLFALFVIAVIPIQTALGQVSTLTLDDCVALALENKETVKSAHLDVRVAELGKRGSLSNILPNVRLSGGYGREDFPKRDIAFDPETGQLIPQVSSVTSVSNRLSISQPLYDGGNWWNQIARASNQLELSRFRQRQTESNVILGVYNSFYQLLKAQQLMGVAKKNLELANQQVGLVQRQFELGAVKKTDLLKAQVRAGQARVEVLNRQTTLDNARRELRNAMGLMEQDQPLRIEEDERDLAPVPDNSVAMETMDRSNPGLLAAQAQIEDTRFSYKITRAIRLPSLNASVSYSASADALSEMTNAYNDNWRLSSGLSLSFPLFTGFDYSTRMQQARIGIMQQEFAFATQRHDQIVQLASLLDVLENYQEIIPITEDVLVSAEEDLRLVQERYTLGSATILEVLDAQVSVTQARSDVITTKYDALIQEANLKAVLGTLDREF